MYDDTIDDFISADEIAEAQELIFAHAHRWLRDSHEVCTVFEEAIRKILKAPIAITEDKVIN